MVFLQFYIVPALLFVWTEFECGIKDVSADFWPVKLMCTLVPLHCQEGLALEENNISQIQQWGSNYKITDYTLQVANHKSQITNYNLLPASHSHKESTNHKLQITDYKSQIANYKLQRANRKLQITANYLQVIVAVEGHLGASSNGVGHFHVTDPHCWRSFVNKINFLTN